MAKFWYTNSLRFLVVVLCSLLFISSSYASSVPRKQSILSESELRDLVRELAPKVNLFKEVWKQNPKALFFAGTSRDFLYWILKHFSEVRSEREKRKMMEYLRSLPYLDIRDMIGQESDCDLVSNQKFEIDLKRFHLRKIDTIPVDRLNPDSEMGRSEIDQGFIPLEKLRIGMNGINEPDVFGNAVAEIISGNLSIQLPDPEKFWRTYYARIGINHPVMLAVRYIRLKAQDYYNRFGPGKPESKNLFDIPEPIVLEIRKIFKSAQGDPRFEALLRNERGLRLLNQSLLKSFRAFTNPTAAMELFEFFGFRDLQRFYPESIEPLNQFLFIKEFDMAQVDRNFEKYKVDREKFFTKASHFFSENIFLHATRSSEAFRSIILNGILPSKGGSVGGGLYGVNLSNEEISIRHAGKEWMVEFDLNPEAKVVDLADESSYAFRIFSQWCKLNGFDMASSESNDKFADAFGISIIRYDYLGGYAFCVKNSRVLGKAKGRYKNILTLAELLKLIDGAKDVNHLSSIVRILMENGLNGEERTSLISRIPRESLRAYLDTNFDSLMDYDLFLRLLFLPVMNAEDVRRLNLSLLKHSSDKDYLNKILSWNFKVGDPEFGLNRVIEEVLLSVSLDSPAQYLMPWILDLLPRASLKTLRLILRSLIDRPDSSEFPDLIHRFLENHYLREPDDRYFLVLLWDVFLEHPSWRKHQELIDRLAIHTIRFFPDLDDIKVPIGEGYIYRSLAKYAFLSPRLKKRIIDNREQKMQKILSRKPFLWMLYSVSDRFNLKRLKDYCNFNLQKLGMATDEI